MDTQNPKAFFKFCYGMLRDNPDMDMAWHPKAHYYMQQARRVIAMRADCTDPELLLTRSDSSWRDRLHYQIKANMAGLSSCQLTLF